MRRQPRECRQKPLSDTETSGTPKRGPEPAKPRSRPQKAIPGLGRIVDKEARSGKSTLEERFAEDLARYGTPAPDREYVFFPGRRWRLDFAWPPIHLAVEIDGGTWNGGRHTSGFGYRKDCAKGRAAVMSGWGVLHYDSKDVRSGLAGKEASELVKARFEKLKQQ